MEQAALMFSSAISASSAVNSSEALSERKRGELRALVPSTSHRPMPRSAGNPPGKWHVAEHRDAAGSSNRRVVLRRLGQVDSDLAEFLAYAVCRSQVALPEGGAFLHDALRKKGNHPLRSAAAVRLGRLKVDDAAVLADLFAVLDSGEENAAEALCWIGPAALPGLIERLQQGSAEMRERLVRP